MLKQMHVNPIVAQTIHASRWPSPRATFFLLVTLWSSALAGRVWLGNTIPAQARALLHLLIWLLPFVTMITAAAATARQMRSEGFQLIKQSPLSDYQISWGLGLSTLYSLRVVLVLAFGLLLALVDDSWGGGVALVLFLTGLHLGGAMLGTGLILRWGFRRLNVILTASCCLLILAMLLNLNLFAPSCLDILSPDHFRLSALLLPWGVKGALPTTVVVILSIPVGWAMSLLPWRGREDGWLPQLEIVGMTLAVALTIGTWVLDTNLAMAREHQALIALYNATGGELWLNHYGWESDQPICSWYGIACACGRVAQIGLPGNNLWGALPPEIGRLTSLKVLDLHNNQLMELPPEIGQLVSFEWLVLFDNQLVKLPPEIGQLANLQWLALSGNSLTRLPAEIGQLTNLQKLDLWSNSLMVLPPEFGQLNNFQVLELHHNRLTELPPEIGQLTKLQRLNLSSNRLFKLPPEIGRLTRLQELYLENNYLTKLPPEIGQMGRLQVLYLMNNQLIELPPDIGQLTRLQVLYLFDNRLTELPLEVSQLTGLQWLYLWGNRLTELSPEICQLRSLTIDAPTKDLCGYPRRDKLTNPEMNIALPDGTLPCGLVQLEWGRHVLSLDGYAACQTAFPQVTMFCLTDQAQWTDDEIHIANVSVDTRTIVVETRREGICGIFPQAACPATSDGCTGTQH